MNVKITCLFSLLSILVIFSCQKEEVSSDESSKDTLVQKQHDFTKDSTTTLEAKHLKIADRPSRADIASRAENIKSFAGPDDPYNCDDFETPDNLCIQSCTGTGATCLSYSDLCEIITENFSPPPLSWLDVLFSYDTDVNEKSAIVDQLLPYLPILQDEEGNFYGCYYIRIRSQEESEPDGTMYPCPDQGFDQSGQVDFTLISPTYTGGLSTYTNDFRFVDDCTGEEFILQYFPFILGNTTIDNLIYNGLLHNGFTQTKANAVVTSIRDGEYSVNQVYDLFVNYVLEYILNTEGYSDFYIEECIRVYKIQFTIGLNEGGVARYQIYNHTETADPVYVFPCL